MNQKRLFLLVAFCSPALSLSVRETHHKETVVYEELFAIQFWNLADTIGILVILGAIGFMCWKLRGCFGSDREENSTVIIVPSRGHAQQSARNVPSPRNKAEPQPKRINYEDYKMKSTSAKTNQAPPPSSPGNPYISENAYESKYKKWTQGTDFQSAARLNEPCILCHQFSRQGERPRIVVSCAADHAFHVSCLNDHRSKILTFMGGNGLYKCPKCKQPYSANVNLYCNVCRKMKINVNLAENSSKDGHLRSEDLRNVYGDCCQDCRVV